MGRKKLSDEIKKNPVNTRDMSKGVVAETVVNIRRKTGLTQTEFSRLFRIRNDTLKHWEYGLRIPPFYFLVCLDMCVDAYVNGRIGKEDIDAYAKRLEEILNNER